MRPRERHCFPVDDSIYEQVSESLSHHAAIDVFGSGSLTIVIVTRDVHTFENVVEIPSDRTVRFG